MKEKKTENSLLCLTHGAASFILFLLGGERKRIVRRCRNVNSPLFSSCSASSSLFLVSWVSSSSSSSCSHKNQKLEKKVIYIFQAQETHRSSSWNESDGLDITLISIFENYQFEIGGNVYIFSFSSLRRCIHFLLFFYNPAPVILFQTRVNILQFFFSK